MGPPPKGVDLRCINFPWKMYLLQDAQAMKVVDDTIEHIGPGSKKSIE